MDLKMGAAVRRLAFAAPFTAAGEEFRLKAHVARVG